MILTHWCRHCGGGANFGDQLAPALFARWGIDIAYAEPRAARLFSVGSLLSRVPLGYRGTIFGTGFIAARHWADLRDARVLAVRGKLSLERINGLQLGLNGTPALGDPGILVEDLLPATPVYAGRALVVPHYVDEAIRDRHPRAELLRITTPPPAFVAAIAVADVVYTSSLHALIAADALGIPHVWEPHREVIGGPFKFRDYTSALGETIVPGVRRLSDRRRMRQAQDRLRGLIPELGGTS